MYHARITNYRVTIAVRPWLSKLRADSDAKRIESHVRECRCFDADRVRHRLVGVGRPWKSQSVAMFINVEKG
jgi:hypothetical protein